MSKYTKLLVLYSCFEFISSEYIENHEQFNNSSKKAIESSPEFKRWTESLCDIPSKNHTNLSSHDAYGDCEVCPKLPNRENDFLSMIRNLEETCPAPTLSEIHDEHYKTLLEMLRTVNSSSFESMTTEFGACPKECRVLLLEKDKERHFKFMNH